MKTKALVLLAGVVVAAVVVATFNQRHRYKEAVQSLGIVQRMTPGRTQIDELKEAFGKDFFGSVNCPSGTCTFTRSFDNMWLERFIFRKSLIFVVELTVVGGGGGQHERIVESRWSRFVGGSGGLALTVYSVQGSREQLYLRHCR